MKIDNDVIEMIEQMVGKGFDVDVTVFDTQIGIHIRSEKQEEQEKPEKNKTEMTKERIAYLFTKEGKTVKEIAKEVALSEQSVRNYLKRAGY